MAEKMGGIICDRCRIIVPKPHGIYLRSSKKKTYMMFCTRQCQVTFFKGKAAWRRGQEYAQKNFDKLCHDSEKCL